VTLLDLLSSSSTCIHSQTKDDSVVIFASAAIAALLSEQMCIYIYIYKTIENDYGNVLCYMKLQPLEQGRKVCHGIHKR
jgi:hypothetical protein